MELLKWKIWELHCSSLKKKAIAKVQCPNTTSNQKPSYINNLKEKILRMTIIPSKNKLCNLTETVEGKILFMKTERNQKATIQGSIMTSSKRLRSQLEMWQTKLVLGFRKNSVTTRKIVHRLLTMKERTHSDWKLKRFLKPTNKAKSVFLWVRMTIILESTPLLQEKKALTDQILQSQKFRLIELSSMKNSTDRSLTFNNL